MGGTLAARFGKITGGALDALLGAALAGALRTGLAGVGFAGFTMAGNFSWA
jgi:hypothetical protein